MKVIKENNGIPIKIWATDIEDGALEQAKNLAKLPFAFKHIALMSDPTALGIMYPLVASTPPIGIPNP